MKTTHHQVPFRTILGLNVQVDEGIFDILTELKRLGVVTQFSCQGCEHAAYVLASASSFRSVLTKIRLYRWTGKLTQDQKVTARNLIRGYRLYEISNFKRDGHYRVWQLKFSRGSKNIDRWAIERTLSKTYGNRTTVRWPKEANADILDLLKVL